MLLACSLHEFAVLALVGHGVTLAVSRVTRPVLRARGVAAVGIAPLAVMGAGQSARVSRIEGPGRPHHLLIVAGVGVARALETLRAQGPVGLPPPAVPILVLPRLLPPVLSLVKLPFVDRYVVDGNVGVAVLLGAWTITPIRGRRSTPAQHGSPRSPYWPNSCSRVCPYGLQGVAAMTPQRSAPPYASRAAPAADCSTSLSTPGP
ncbi:hypothetical protein STTU_1004 [Streptomyces sp. Tu6071]|nr:hypothetical protein STTU_1004 [Streptomyces sp. Tu6071]